MIYNETYIVKSNDFNDYKLNIKGLGISASIGKIVDYDGDFSITINDEETSDFTISDDYILTFDIPLEFGDKITIVDEVVDNVKIIAKNKYDKRALFKIYGTEDKIAPAQRYNVSMSIKGDDISYEFSTLFNDLYASVYDIRVGTGDVLNGIDDSTILSTIYKVSKRALSRIERDDVDIDLEEDDSLLRDYVFHTVRYEFIYGVYLTLCSKSGTNSKTIGDVSIREGVRGIPKEFLSSAKKLMDEAEAALFGSFSVSNFIKAGSTSYPVDGRGVF